MLTLAQPRAIRSWNCSGFMPVPPWSAIGIGSADTMSLTRWLSRVGVVLYMPCAFPIAGAKQSMPVDRMKSSATSSDWMDDAESDPIPSSTPWMPSISPSTAAP
jgi:hypothetical protein